MSKELKLKLANGWSICCGAGTDNQWGGYVRVCDAKNKEILYYDNQEFADDPELVLGALVNCAANKIRV